MKLSILISTIDDGINNIEDIILARRNDVEYVVSHQYTEEKHRFIPKELFRDDVLVSQIRGKGLSKSRNNAIKHAKGDIAVIADDDVRYKPDYFDTVIETYRNNDVDVACFKIKTPDGEPEYKNYPKKEIEVLNFTEYSPSSIEVTFRVNSAKKNIIHFDNRFGLGARFVGGEEKLFLYDAIEMGLKVKFYPLYVVQHPYESSNKSLNKFDSEIVGKKAAYDCRINGFISFPRTVLGILKNFRILLKHNVNPFHYAYHRMSAIIHILFTQKTKKY